MIEISTIFKFFGFVLLDLVLFLYAYIASMGMIRAYAEKKLNGVLWALCLPGIAIAWVVDVLHNLTLFSLFFWEIPKEFTVTARMKRHVTQKSWRGNLSRWAGLTLLNPFDHTGDHLD